MGYEVNQTATAHTSTVPEMENISLQMSADQLHAFFPILQKGVTVPATVGCTLRSLLCDQLAIPADYLTDRITTIFIDNHPLDDLDRTIVQDGSRVTLSAAMPGLVGATMRRGGFYAALRQGISNVTDSGAAKDACGEIRLKLFNLLLAEIGPLVLARGVILEQCELADLLQNLTCRPENRSSGTGRVLLTVQLSE